VTTLRERERKSHAIRKGDVFVTQAGSILYLVSSDRHHKLVLAKFLRSTSLTGQVSVSTIISFFSFFWDDIHYYFHFHTLSLYHLRF
jgi:hypothetical protein